MQEAEEIGLSGRAGMEQGRHGSKFWSDYIRYIFAMRRGVSIIIACEFQISRRTVDLEITTWSDINVRYSLQYRHKRKNLLKQVSLFKLTLRQKPSTLALLPN